MDDNKKYLNEINFIEGALGIKLCRYQKIMLRQMLRYNCKYPVLNRYRDYYYVREMIKLIAGINK